MEESERRTRQKTTKISRFSGATTPRMKLHGKGKTFSRQSIHIYLRISRNLEDEIFPKGVGVVTPKILFGFFKLLFDLRGI